MSNVSIIIDHFNVQFKYQLTCRAPPGAVFYPARVPHGRKTLEIWNSVNVLTVYKSAANPGLFRFDPQSLDMADPRGFLAIVLRKSNYSEPVAPSPRFL